MELFAFLVLGIFSFLWIARVLVLLGKLRDGGDGFLRTFFWYIHFLVTITNLELTLILAASFLYLTPGEVSRTLAAVALAANAMIAIRAARARKLFFSLAHLLATLLCALWTFPALAEALSAVF